jgi:hypothetical protein
MENNAWTRDLVKDYINDNFDTKISSLGQLEDLEWTATGLTFKLEEGAEA